MMAKWNKRLVLWIRAWLRMANEEHRHWCLNKGGERCYHSSICWYCTDPFCAGVESKDCPNCVAGHSKTCKGTAGSAALRCTCGYGRG
jgi:hypothetical protein